MALATGDRNAAVMHAMLVPAGQSGRSVADLALTAPPEIVAKLLTDALAAHGVDVVDPDDELSDAGFKAGSIVLSPVKPKG